MNFPKYDQYTDSGVEWLGEVPAHWKTSKSKWLWREIDDRSENGDEELLSISQYTGVTPTTRDSRSESLEGYRRCKPNDLAMNIMLAWQGGLGISNYDGIVSPAYSIFRLVTDDNPHYLGYLYRTKLYLDEFGRNSTGIVPSRWRLYPDKFGHIQTLLPPKPEQDRIVDFLDQKTAEIDALIAKKERQIQLLDEQKAIRINRAVTRGLDPTVKLKPSGIEWIGDIPEHWGILRLGAIAKFTSGGTPAKEREDFWDGDVPWVSPKDMKRPVLNSAIETITEKALSATNIKLLPVNTVLIVVRGKILQRYVPLGINSVPVTINQDMKGLILKNEVMNPEYLSDLLSACQEAFESIIDEAGHGTKCIRTENLKAIMLCTPSLSEQRSILESIQNIRIQTTKATQQLSSLMSNLKTLRSTLIAHTVTGKIKV